MGRKPRVDRSPEEKWQIVQEGLKSGNVSETCRRHGIAPNLFYRRKDEAEQAAKAALGGRSERSVCRRQLQLGEKRGSAIGPTRRGKGSKIMAISDGHGLPLAVHVASASPHETKLVEATLENRFFADLPERLIGDRAYDSDRLDERLMNHYGIEMIAPHNSIRTRTLTQDGRGLRRYRRRWKVERLFAWLHNYRRIVVRWERHPENFLAMLHLASAIILLRHL
jgi:transposase